MFNAQVPIPTSRYLEKAVDKELARIIKSGALEPITKKSKFQFFPKTPKIVLLIAQQPNIAQRPFRIQNERQDILYHFIIRPLL